jgi:hypothetical protein
VWLAFCLLAWLGSAAAHTNGTTGYAAVTVAGQTVRYALTLTLDVLESSKVVPVIPGRPLLPADYDGLTGMVARSIVVEVDSAACAALPGTVQAPSLDRPTVVIVTLFACQKPITGLSLRDNIFDVLGPDHHTLASLEWNKGSERIVFEPDRRETRITLAATTGSSVEGTAENDKLAFFRLGIEHIVEGFDHILFLLALILGGGRAGAILGIATAFTVAHSITLALAVLDVFAPPPRIVEPLIALSIAYVALENIMRPNAAPRRWAVGFLFGLVHGFGFAGALRTLGLPLHGLYESLVFFNLGIEIGQLIIIAITLPLVLWLYRHAWRRRAVTTLSAGTLAVAVIMLIGRIALPGD